MKQKKGLFKKLDEKFDYNNIMSWIVGILGVVGGILSACCLGRDGFWTAMIGTLAAELLVGIAWAWSIYNKHTLVDEQMQMEQTIENLSSEVKELKEYETTQEDKFLSEKNEIMGGISAIAMCMKNISKLNNDFCVRIPEIAERSYHLLETLGEEPQWSPESIDKELLHAYKEFSNGLFDVFKRYTSNLLNHCVNIEETYLKIAGHELAVAATIKLFHTPYFPKRMRRDEIIVYTAYRDKKTYENHREREIGEEPYTIDGNADFSLCLKKEQFIINNASKGMESYANEHTDFDAYYNCAVVVPIRTKLSDGSYVYYGYLCCDCLNENNNVDVFDSVSAKFLFAVAQQYALFIDTLETNWSDRVDEIPDADDFFLNRIYENTYKGKKK